MRADQSTGVISTTDVVAESRRSVRVKWVSFEMSRAGPLPSRSLLKLLNQTQATGPIVAATVGRMKGAVDLIAADGKRQRIVQVPVENRPNRGKKLVKVRGVAEVWVP